MPNIIPDYELLCRFVKGDRNAFDAIYKQYFHAVYANALKITRDKTVAEDILQEVFIALWEKRKTIDTERSLGNWIFVVCYNKSISALRKELRRTAVYDELQNSYEPDTLNSAALQELQWQTLEDAMNTLSAQKRKVFELCKLQGKTYKETAAVLQISEYTVKEYLSAATVVIKKHVQRMPEWSVVTATGFIFAILY